MTLARYHALVRELVRGSPRAPRAPGEPRVYASLVRLQHRQPLVQVYGPAAERTKSAAVLNGLFDRFIEERPPRDAHPGIWAVGFADYVVDRADVPLAVREHVDFLALRLSQSLEPDTEALGRGTVGEVRAYVEDPRGARSSGPAVLLVFRDDRGHVQTLDATASVVGAWGLACGRCEIGELERKGLDSSALEAARRRLAEAGHPLFRA